MLQDVHFEKQPVISLDLSGDVTSPTSFWANLRAESDQITTRWGKIEHFQLISGIRPQSNSVAGLFYTEANGLSMGTMRLDNFRSEGTTVWNAQMEQLLTNHWTIIATNFVSPKSKTMVVEAQVTSSQASPTNQIVSKLIVRSAPFSIFNATTGQSFNRGIAFRNLPFPSPAMLLREILPSTNRFVAGSQPPANSVSGKWTMQTRRFDTPQINCGGHQFQW